MKTVSPTKQRKNIFQSKLTQRYPLFHVPLAPDLRRSHKTRSVVVVSGDTVRVTRGGLRGTEGKVTEVNRKRFGVAIEGITRENSKGMTVPVYIHPSNLIITKLSLKDKWREKALKRKAAVKEAKPLEGKKRQSKSIRKTGKNEIK